MYNLEILNTLTDEQTLERYGMYRNEIEERFFDRLKTFITQYQYKVGLIKKGSIEQICEDIQIEEKPHLLTP